MEICRVRGERKKKKKARAFVVGSQGNREGGFGWCFVAFLFLSPQVAERLLYACVRVSRRISCERLGFAPCLYVVCRMHAIIARLDRLKRIMYCDAFLLLAWMGKERPASKAATFGTKSCFLFCFFRRGRTITRGVLTKVGASGGRTEERS